MADRRLGYRAFNAVVNRLANALLAEGLRKGDKIASILPNCLELLALYWAIAKTGIIVVPLSPLLKAAALGNLLADSDTTMVFIDETGVAELERIRDQLPAIGADRYVLVGGADRVGYRAYADFVAGAPDGEPPDAGLGPGDIYNIIYSSGTTGEPKGIVHTHYVRMMYAGVFASTWRMTPESIVLHAGAIVFNGSLTTLMPCFFLGATYILHRAFDAEAVIDAVAREKVTHMMMVPSQIVAFLDSPSFASNALGSLEMVLSMGAPLHLEHKRRLDAELPGRFHELYGVTEGFCTILDKLDFAAKPESVGVPPPFFEIRIVDGDGRDRPTGEVGEIVGRSPILMSGYHNRPDLTDDAFLDGWLCSGDLGYVDEDGFLYLVDRKKDMIISGGVNVYPRDIEEVAVRHPAVQEVAVFGIPDQKWGETPVAAVRLREAGAIEAEALRDWINRNVEARYQRVSRVVILEDFPRNAAGKTLKRVLREQLVPA